VLWVILLLAEKEKGVRKLNKKHALVSIVLIALMSLSLAPLAFGHHTPSSADDMLYEEFGPRPSQLLIKVYTDYTAELAGFMAKEVDVMDWALEPVDYQGLETLDPLHQQYSTAFYSEFGAFQYDINGQVMPTSLISVRQALAHIIDKTYFINTYIAGMGRKLDSVLNYLGTGWYNPAVTDLYNLQPRTTVTPLPDDPLDWETAYDLLVADLGPPVPDPDFPGDFMFTWTSPYPTPGPPPNSYPAVPDGHLLMFARSEMQPRTDQGLALENYLEVVFPEILQSLGKPRTRMYVDLFIVPRAITRTEVFTIYRYHLYTGGWILGRDPDFIIYYTTGFIAKPDPGGGNYVMYSNPSYDAEVDAMIVSNAPGSELNPSDGVYHAWLAQAIMEADEPVIWMWSTAGYKAVLSNWRGVVNQVGFGLNSWWTFMNAWKLGGIGKHDIIRYGWAGDLISLNVISAQWYWDYEVLGKVYDTLISVNPYNMADDRPWMAKSWTVGEWTSGVDTNTVVKFTLRDDMYWQDVPFLNRAAIAVGGGNQLNGPFLNVGVTPVDIAFSGIYQAANSDSWNGYLWADVAKVGLNPVWQSMWPYDTVLPPWWVSDPTIAPWDYNYVEWDSTLGTYDIAVYMGVKMPWLALHWVGGILQIPFHIWSQIPITNSDAVATWTFDIVYGSGPWILLSRTPGIENVLIDYRAGQTYRGVTLVHEFWGRAPVIGSLTGTAINVGWLKTRDCKTDVGRSLIFNKILRIYNRLITGAVSVTYYFDFRIELWSGTAWVPRLTFQTAPVVVNVPAFSFVDVSTSKSFSPSDLKDDVLKRFGYVRVYESFHIEYTWATNNFVIHFETPVPEVFTTAAADINGDGIVNIADSTLVGLHWQYQWSTPP